MKRLVLAATVVASFALGAPAATACTLETCVGTSPVCQKVGCHVCYYQPGGAQKCIVQKENPS